MIKRNPWHSWIFAFLMLFLYNMGIYDLFMMLTHNEGYYASHGYGKQVVDYFTGYPIYFLILWVTNLACGFLSPILLIIRNRWSTAVALASAMADLLLLLLTFAFRNRLSVLGLGVAGFDVIVLFITFCFYLYCRYTNKHPI